METLKVSTKSNPNSVAGAVAGAVRQAGAVEIQIVGAGALNQAIKAVAIARGYVIASGIDLVCVPTFADILIDGERRTALRLSIEDRSGRYGESVDGRPVGQADTADAAVPAAAAPVPSEPVPSEPTTPPGAAAAALLSLQGDSPAEVSPADPADPVGPALAGAPVGGPSAAGVSTIG